MSKLTKKDTLRVAELAKLTLTSSQVDEFSDQLSKVVDMMDDLNEVDTKNTEPTSQTTGLINVLRDDEIDVTRCLPQDGFFEVAQILHKDEN